MSKFVERAMAFVPALVAQYPYSIVRSVAVSNSPTPSRREARREARREGILDVAARSFLEQGYAGTTMSAIAAILGGSKGTLWNYFASKELLFAAVIERVSQDFREQVSLILNPRSGVEPALRRFCVEYLRKVTSPEAIALYRLVVGESSRFPEIGTIFFETAPRLTQQLLGEFLSKAMELGLLRREDPLFAARQLTALCLAGSHQQLLVGTLAELSPEAIAIDATRAMDAFMRIYNP